MELYFAGASQAVLVVKNPPTNEGRCKRCGFNPWVGEISLEEGMATHSHILVWRIPWIVEPGGLWPIELQRGGHTDVL